MRQAGRSLPEYRALRETNDILTLCRTPDLAAEVTMQPVRRLGVDAAILFSDIVVPFAGMGIDVDIVAGTGPVVDRPVRSAADVERIQPLDPVAGVPYVLETIDILVRELSVPLIGFGGAPFTLASYLVEGGPSKDHARTKALMYSDPATWHKLMDRLAESVLAYLRAQIEHGVEAVQLFDSWIGALDPDDYREYVLPAVERIFEGLGSRVPKIYFGVNTSQLLDLMAGSGADVVGIDWRVPMATARARLGPQVVLQGNLDPAALLGPWDVIEAKARTILEATGGTRHIFNLGHGVLPDTDPELLTRLVAAIHSWDRP
ncbi:MAG: uroporphyrinogen decarboxylase [Actinomycetota bacterium]|nr:uroporphyrinogen decarboxylase [Actinomycetota bacterium]